MRTIEERWGGDCVCELTVWGLLVYKVKMLSCYMEHFGFFDHKTPGGPRDLFRRLVWNRLYVNHQHLYHKDTK